MTSQHEEATDSNENRSMWIAVGVIVALILGGMSINMLVHDSSADAAHASSPAP